MPSEFPDMRETRQQQMGRKKGGLVGAVNLNLFLWRRGWCGDDGRHLQVDNKFGQWLIDGFHAID